MPMLIDPIDKIAREKKRDVLFVSFYTEFNAETHRCVRVENYKTCEARRTLMQWLLDNDIKHYPCGPFIRGFLIEGYFGDIYIDVPFDKAHPDYQKLETHLEDEQGHTKIPGVVFYLLPLERAMENADHDDPKFLAED